VPLPRRAWRWSLALIGCAAVAVAIRGFWLEPARLTLAEETLTLPGSARGPLRVAVLADLHVGSPFNGIAKLRDVVDRTNAATPDLVCILGDLVIQGVTPRPLPIVGVKNVTSHASRRRY
jgi:uncharacterized protein